MKVVKIVIAVLSLTAFIGCKTHNGGGGPCPAYGNNMDLQKSPIENVATTSTTTVTNS